MNEEVLNHLRSLRGLVATVVLTGAVDENFSQALSDLRSWCDRQGFHRIEWRKFPAQLVEAGRDMVLTHALNPKGDGTEPAYDWVLQIDADAFPIQEDALLRILHTAFIALPNSDVVGAYCQLKSPPYLPTIDTGTGTWEPIFPGEGALPVIRTGGHFILIKPPILKRFGPPWFRTRQPHAPLKAMAEVDNFARIKLDGRNPMSASDEWGKLLELAKTETSSGASVGEDSGFCDQVRAAGGSIYVDTNLVIGHVAKKVISPVDLRDSMKESKMKARLAVGVYE